MNTGIPVPAPSLAERRLALQRQSQQLRERLALEAQILAAPLALADRVRAAGGWLLRHPEWPAAAAVVLLLARPRRTWVWARRGWRLWRLYRRLRTGLSTLGVSTPRNGR